MSTSRNCVGSPTSKKFSSCVRPGVTEVRAIARRPVSALSSEDLPTFERPAKAIPGASGSGRNLSCGAESRNSTRPENSRLASRARSSLSPIPVRPELVEGLLFLQALRQQEERPFDKLRANGQRGQVHFPFSR